MTGKKFYRVDAVQVGKVVTAMNAGLITHEEGYTAMLMLMDDLRQEPGAALMEQARDVNAPVWHGTGYRCPRDWSCCSMLGFHLDREAYEVRCWTCGMTYWVKEKDERMTSEP